MTRILLFNKPYQVLCQFTDSGGRTTLGDFLQGKEFQGFYPAGRLDYDSEGLMLLTDDGKLQARIAHPKYKLPKTYWVQVEGQITETALTTLRQGVELNDGVTAPAKARKIEQPRDLWPRHPPIRARANIATEWLELAITEGRNRQIRRMTAAVGLPTLRLVRIKIGDWNLDDLQPSEFDWRSIFLPKSSNQTKTRHTRPAASGDRRSKV